MEQYPFNTIRVNGTQVPIEKIRSGTCVSASPFESNLFSFVKQWFDGANEFTITTSGSTGEPKSIVITRDQMIASAKLTLKALRLKAGGCALVCLDAKYIAGRMMLVRSFIGEMMIEAVEASANPFITLADKQIHFTALVPMQLFEITRSSISYVLNNVSTILVGGGVLDAETVTRLQDYDCTCYATYGMTETISHVALRKINGSDIQPYYNALPGISFTQDERGCLVIAGAIWSVPIITNDLVDLINEQNFVWLGRWDNVINSGGKKIIPEQLESKVQGILDGENIYNRFFIASLPDAKFGNKLILVVEKRIEDDLITTLRRKLKLGLPGHEVPKEIIIYPYFVETTNGKINRKETLNLTSAISDSTR